MDLSEVVSYDGGIMSERFKNRLFFALKIVFAAGLIWAVWRSGNLDFKELGRLITPLNVIVAVGLVGLNLWFLSWRWHWLLSAREFDVTKSSAFRLSLIGVFFSFALPSSVGGDVVKAYYIGREHHQRRMEAVMSVLVDRLLGVYAMLLISVVALAVDWRFVSLHADLRAIAVATMILFIGLNVFFALSFSESLSRRSGLRWLLGLHPRLRFFEKLLDVVGGYGQSKKVLAVSVLLSMVGQFFTVLMFMYVGRQMGVDTIGWPAYFFVVQLGFLVTALPIAPAGVGVGQVAFVYLFRLFDGHSSLLGATSVTAFQMAMLVWGLAGAVFYLRWSRLKGVPVEA